MKVNTKREYLRRRHYRIRNKLNGTAARPRMSVFRSQSHLYVQFIDDDASETLASASTMSGALKGAPNNSETAGKLGKEAAEAAKAKGIETVVFDRGGFAYAGKIKLIAEAAREEGLKF
jgi:large subunit ribosomal protein L18